MNTLGAIAILNVCLLGGGVTSAGSWEASSIGDSPIVFGGQVSTLRVALRNTSQVTAAITVGVRWLQIAGTIAAPVGPVRPGATLQAAPAHVVLAEVSVSVPDVRVATHFLAEWSDERGAVLGRTPVEVVPRNSLAELSGPVRLLGVDSSLARALKDAGVRAVEDPAEAQLWFLTGDLGAADRLEARKAVQAGAVAVRFVEGVDIPVILRDGAGAWLDLPMSILTGLAGEARMQAQFLRCVRAAARHRVPDPDRPDL